MSCLLVVLGLGLSPQWASAQNRSSASHASSYEAREEWWVMNPDGCSSYVAEFGKGPPVIVIHGGFGAEHSYLLDALSSLAKTHHLIFYDQRGSLRSPMRVYENGGSLACPDSLISLDKFVEDLERLRGQLGLGQFSIVAHSMGAAVALTYLQRFPEHVRGLVLLAPGIPVRPVRDSALLVEQKAAVNALFDNPQIEIERKKAGVDHPPLSDKQRIEEWRIRYAAANLYDVSKWRYLRGGMAFFNARAGAAAYKTLPADYDFIPALRARSCPSAIVVGDHDVADMGARVIQHQLAGISNMRLTVIKNAGHSLWVDQPAAVQTAIRKGLSLC